MATLITGVGAAFVQSVFPVLLIGSLGYVVGRARSLDLAPSTPVAVTSALWALEFDARPALVSAAVVVLSTLASVVTLTVLLAVLTSGS